MQPINKAFDPAIVIERYPAPIAHAYAGLHESASPLERLFALKDLFEVALKYCALVMVQDYLRLGIQSTPVDSALAQYLARPHWETGTTSCAKSRAAARAIVINYLFPSWPTFILSYGERRGGAAMNWLTSCSSSATA